MSRNNEINELLATLAPDLEKFYDKGNKAAGTRARQTLQQLKNKSQEIRLEIQEWKNSGRV